MLSNPAASSTRAISIPSIREEDVLQRSHLPRTARLSFVGYRKRPSLCRLFKGLGSNADKSFRNENARVIFCSDEYVHLQQQVSSHTAVHSRSRTGSQVSAYLRPWSRSLETLVNQFCGAYQTRNWLNVHLSEANICPFTSRSCTIRQQTLRYSPLAARIGKRRDVPRRHSC